jgi:hypothetical protein
MPPFEAAADRTLQMKAFTLSSNIGQIICYYNAMQCNEMQCNAMQCNAMQCNAMQCNAMQYNAMQCNAMVHFKTIAFDKTIFFSFCTIGTRITKQVANCSKEHINELYNQFCKPNGTLHGPGPFNMSQLQDIPV